jgi:hypothetical protein
LKALSIQQPWVHAILREGKDIENRSWQRDFRDWIASTHTTDAVNVAVPDSYLSAAKALFIKTNYGPDPTHFNTWLFYDPARPNRTDMIRNRANDSDYIVGH